MLGATKIDQLDSFLADRVGFARNLWVTDTRCGVVNFRKGDRGYEIFANEWFSWAGDLSAAVPWKCGGENKNRSRLESWQTCLLHFNEAKENRLISLGVHHLRMKEYFGSINFGEEKKKEVGQSPFCICNKMERRLFDSFQLALFAKKGEYFKSINLEEEEEEKKVSQSSLYL